MMNLTDNDGLFSPVCLEFNPTDSCVPAILREGIRKGSSSDMLKPGRMGQLPCNRWPEVTK